MKIKVQPRYSARIVVLAIILGIAFIVFFMRLFQFQVIMHDELAAKGASNSTTKIEMEAPRGEIVDRYGNPIVVNREGYSVVLDKNFLSDEKENETIRFLITMLKDNNQDWEKTIPIEIVNGQVEFQVGKDDEIATIKKKLELNDYATAQNCYYGLVEKYKVDEGSMEANIEIIQVRYEMDIRGFSNKNHYVFARDVSMQIVSKIKENSVAYPGVDIIEDPHREYTDGTIAPHIVGTVGSIPSGNYKETYEPKGYKLDDIVGRDGIEFKLEDQLRGKNGIKTVRKNSDGQVTTTVQKEPTAGNTVVLTLDKNLQQKSYESLEYWVKHMQSAGGKGSDADAGSVVAIDVKTGGILAAATYPSYDANTYYDNYSQLLQDATKPLTNRAFNGAYEPGSTMKPCIATAGLAEGVIGPSETITCVKKYMYYAPTYTPSCMGRHGAINVVKALEVSCNYFFFEVGRRLGINRIDAYATDFGLGQKVGIELNESSGILAGPEYRNSIGQQWHDGDTIQAAIGQSDNMFTPVQLATYCATIANNGKRLQTHLVKSVKSYDFKQTVQEENHDVVATVNADESVFGLVRQGMRQVATSGTGKWVFQHYTPGVACKTGTAEVPNGTENSIFIGFAPYDDPEIAIAVVLEHGYTNARANLHVAKDVFDAYFNAQSDNQDMTPPNELLP